MTDLRPDLAHLAAAPPLAGSERVAVEIGGVGVAVEGVPPVLAAALRARYGPFLAEAPGAHTVRVFRGAPKYLDMAPDRFIRIEEERHGEAAVLLSHDFAALRAAAGNRLLVSDPDDIKRTERAVENYLRWVVADLVLERDGLVLHSAGLARGGAAYVFFGPSGAGKSTVTELTPEAAVLSDDLVLLQRREGRWEALTTPFLGTYPQLAKDTRRFPLVGIYRLRQAPEVAVRPLSLAVAVGMVLACCPFVRDPGRRSAALVPRVEELCRAVPVRELAFRRDASFWNAILDSSRSLLTGHN